MNTFFKKVGAFGEIGVWSKIHYAWMPIIGGSLDNAFLNYKSNEVDVVPKSEYWSLVEGGIKSLKSGVGGRNNFQSTDNINGNNISIACHYVDTNAPNGILVSFGKDYSEIYITGRMSDASDAQCSVQRHNGTQLMIINSSGISDNPRILSVNGTEAKVLLNRNVKSSSMPEEISFVSNSDGTLLIEPLSFLVRGANEPTNGGASILFIGEALTDDEMLLLNDAMKEFKEKYLAN